ncbi:MAG: hypothetical protein DMG70_02775, partial [Acidobacteria bacterium]
MGTGMVVWNHLRMSLLPAFFIGIVCIFSLSQMGQPAPACTGPADLESVIHSHPSAAAYNALGAYFGQHQKLSCAISAFESAIGLDPGSWEARFNLSLTLIQDHQPQRAVRELRIAVRAKPEDPLGHTAWGVALSELNQNDAAIEEFRLALKTDPKSVPALHGLAKALIAQKRYSAAIAALRDAPADSQLQDDLAVAYSQNGDVAQAVQLLRELVKQNPSSPDEHANLAIAYTQQQQFRQAVDEFREALRLDP